MNFKADGKQRKTIIVLAIVAVVLIGVVIVFALTGKNGNGTSENVSENKTESTSEETTVDMQTEEGDIEIDFSSLL